MIIFADLFAHTFVDMFAGVFLDMFTDIFVAMRTDMFVYIFVDTFVAIFADVVVDVLADVFVDMFVNGSARSGCCEPGSKMCLACIGMWRFVSSFTRWRLQRAVGLPEQQGIESMQGVQQQAASCFRL